MAVKGFSFSGCYNFKAALLAPRAYIDIDCKAQTFTAVDKVLRALYLGLDQSLGSVLSRNAIRLFVMHSQSSHRSPLKTITSVSQNIRFDLREFLENKTASALGTTKSDLYTQQEKSQDPQQLSNAASTRYENPSSHITRKTKHQDSATRPYLTLLDPGEQTSLSTTQNGASCLCCQGSITKNKSVLSTILAPVPGRSISQSVPVLDGEGDRIVPTAATYTSPLFVFPDPYEPPADQDNSSIWKAVMAAKKSKQSKSKANAKAAPTVAPSAGARGSSGFKRFLIKLLGKELDENSELTYEGPDSHFGPEQEHPPVTKYVKMYSGKEAAKFANIMRHFILPAKYSESELGDFFNRYIFTSNLDDEPLVPPLEKMDFDQKALKQKTEYTSRFQNYSISELRRGVADIRHLRLSPEERYEGRSTTNTPNLLLAETDLRGRCDMAFGIDERCLQFLSEGNVGGPVPCHDPVAGVCSIFGRAEVKKLDDSNSVEAARHQWASSAYLELLSRVKLADSRTDKSCRPVSYSTPDFRQYGYIICAAHVEIWVMRVTSFTSIQTDIPTRRDTFYREEYLSFPAVRLASLQLWAPRAVEQFCQWHAKIMNWGFNVYSRRYVDNIEDLHRSRRPVQDWTLSYEEAVGKDIPPLPEDEQEDSKSQPIAISLIVHQSIDHRSFSEFNNSIDNRNL